MGTLAFSVHKIKSGMVLIVSTDAVQAGSFSMETVFALTILSGIHSAVLLVPVAKSGTHFQGLAHVRPIQFGMDFHVSPAMVEDSMMPTPKNVSALLDQTGMVCLARKPVLIRSFGIQPSNNVNVKSIWPGTAPTASHALVEDITIHSLVNANVWLELGTVSHVFRVQPAKEE
jgi:hypothetical protein